MKIRSPFRLVRWKSPTSDAILASTFIVAFMFPTMRTVVSPLRPPSDVVSPSCKGINYHLLIRRYSSPLIFLTGTITLSIPPHPSTHLLLFVLLLPIFGIVLLGNLDMSSSESLQFSHILSSLSDYSTDQTRGHIHLTSKLHLKHKFINNSSLTLPYSSHCSYIPYSPLRDTAAAVRQSWQRWHTVPCIFDCQCP